MVFALCLSGSRMDWVGFLRGGHALSVCAAREVVYLRRRRNRAGTVHAADGVFDELHLRLEATADLVLLPADGVGSVGRTADFLRDLPTCPGIGRAKGVLLSAGALGE